MEISHINNSAVEIIKLKADLMSRHSNSISDTKFASDCAIQVINEEKGKILEDNIRQSLVEKLGWKQDDLPRKIYYREILLDNKYSIIILKGQEKNFQYNNIVWKLKLEENGEIEISYRGHEGKDEKISIGKDRKLIARESTAIDIQNFSEKETDGLFCISEFNLSSFNMNEIEVIYQNIKDFKDIHYLAIEVKLSGGKMSEMVGQLRKDESIIRELKGERVLYLGVLGEVPNFFQIKEVNVNFNCLIFGLKKSKFFDRNVCMFYDWKLIKKVSNIENELSNIRSEFSTELSNIRREFSTELSNIRREFSTELSNIRTELSELKKIIFDNKVKKVKQSVNFTKKKRKREKKDNNDK